MKKQKSTYRLSETRNITRLEAGSTMLLGKHKVPRKLVGTESLIATELRVNDMPKWGTTR